MRLIVCLSICLLQIFTCTAGENALGVLNLDGVVFVLTTPTRISVKEGILIVKAASAGAHDAMSNTLTVKLSLDGATSEAPVLEITKDFDSNQTEFNFNVSKYAPYLSEQNNVPSNITVTATLKKRDSDVQVTTSFSVEIYPFSYNITCWSSQCCTYFEPYTLKNVDLKITDVQRPYLRVLKDPVQLIYNEVLKAQGGKVALAQTSGNRSRTFTSKRNADGIAKFNVFLPNLEEYPGYDHYYEMQLKYKDEIQKIGVTGHNLSFV